MPAIELMNTTAAGSTRLGMAAWHTRKCARTLTAKVLSQSSTLVPSSRRPSPMPTFSTSPSSAPGAPRRRRRPRRSPRGGRRRPRGPRRSRHCPRSVRPSRAWRPVAVGAGDHRTFPGRERGDGAPVADRRVGIVGVAVPAPMTSTLRPSSRPRPGARPAASSGSSASMPTRAVGRPGTPGSRCTPSEFSAKASMWYCPTSIGSSIICRSS